MKWIQLTHGILFILLIIGLLGQTSIYTNAFQISQTRRSSRFTAVLHARNAAITMLGGANGRPSSGKLNDKAKIEPTYSAGIDLGTTYSLVSVVENGKPHLLKVDGSVLLPSVVGFTPNGTVLVGKEAQKYAIHYPKDVFSSVKRLIGRTMKEARATGDLRQFGKRLQPIVHINSTKEIIGLVCPSLNEIKQPEEISSHVLKKLLKCASEYYGGKEVSNAVITVPAYFTKLQNEATERAGKLAGLKKIKLLKEPEAAAFAYGLDVNEPRVVMVFDLGGGTFDVSVLEVGAGLVEVIATSGDGHLGGDDFDQIIIDYILHKIELQSKKCAQELQTDPKMVKRIRELAIVAKHDLTTKPNATIDVVVRSTGEKYTVMLARKKFEELSRGLLTRLLTPVRQAALMAGINLPGESGDIGIRDLPDDDDEEEVEDKSQKEEIGENTMIPNLKDMKQLQSSGRKASKDKLKQKGNAGKELSRLKKFHGDSSMKLFPGGKSLDDVILVGGATRMPCIYKSVRIMTGIDPKRHINPDEAICLGAGVMSGVLDNTIESFQVLSPWQSALLRFMHEEKEKGNPDFLGKNAAQSSVLTENTAKSKIEVKAMDDGSSKPAPRKSFINKILANNKKKLS